MPELGKNELRGLSLFGLSPHAIAYGAKRIETRSWPAPEWVIGHRVAIHCSKSLPAGGLYGLELWMLEPQNHAWLLKAGYLKPDPEFASGFDARAADLPRGCFVCTAEVTGCLPTELLAQGVNDLEFSHGDYSPGRYGWTLAKVRRLKEPVVCPGALQLFKIDETTQASIRQQEIKRTVPPMPSATTEHRAQSRSFTRGATR